MLRIAVVGNIETDLVQARRPVERLAGDLARKPPLRLGLRVQRVSRAGHAPGLLFVDLVTRHHGAYRALPLILVLQAAEQLVEQTLAHRPFGNLQLANIQYVQQLGEDGQAAGPHLGTAFGQAAQRHVGSGLEFEDLFDELLDDIRGQARNQKAQFPRNRFGGAHRARGANNLDTVGVAKKGLYGAQLELRRLARANEALGRDLSAGEKALRHRNAAELQALQLARL